MARKPFLPLHSQSDVQIGAEFLDQRPDHLKLIAKCIVHWTDVLHNQGVLLGLLMGTSSEAAVAMFSALQSSPVRRSAINAAANYRFAERPGDLDLLIAVMSVIGSAEKERNDLAHGCFGISPGIPDGVLWLSTSDFGPWNTSVVLKASGSATREDQIKLVKRLYYYLKSDLEEILAKIEEAKSILHHLMRYIDERLRANGTLSPVSDELCAQLRDQPRIAEALARIEEKRKKKQSPPQSPQP